MISLQSTDFQKYKGIAKIVTLLTQGAGMWFFIQFLVSNFWQEGS